MLVCENETCPHDVTLALIIRHSSHHLHITWQHINWSQLRDKTFHWLTVKCFVDVNLITTSAAPCKVLEVYPGNPHAFALSSLWFFCFGTRFWSDVQTSLWVVIVPIFWTLIYMLSCYIPFRVLRSEILSRVSVVSSVWRLWAPVS